MCRGTTYRSSGAEAPRWMKAIDILLLRSRRTRVEFDVEFHMCSVQTLLFYQDLRNFDDMVLR